MTIRKTGLILLALLSFAAAGALSPPTVWAQDASGGARGSGGHHGRFAQRMMERRQERGDQGQQGSGQDRGWRQGQDQGRDQGQYQPQDQQQGYQRSPQADNGQGNLGQNGSRETMRQRRAALREELMKLPPDQRRQRIQQLRQEMSRDKQQSLEERKQKFQSRWDKASPEQRARFCGNVQRKCSDGQAGSFACQVAQGQCAGK